MFPWPQDEVLIQESFHVPGRGYFSFFGVFDGHGGRNAAIFTRDHLFDLLLAELQAGAEPTRALTNAYLNTDQLFIAACRGEEDPAAAAAAGRQSSNLAVKIPAASPNQPAPRAAGGLDVKDTSGTTAVSILLHHDTYTLYVANCGDSRAVLSGENGSVISLTSDHKADRPDEVDRIRRAGGFVVHKRVMGELAISRAIGDLDFKETGFLFVLADPELCTQQLTTNDRFVLLACDGVYDVMSNEQACIFVRESIAGGADMQVASERLVRHAIGTLNTRDNVTAILVKLPTAEELAAANVRAPSVARIDTGATNADASAAGGVQAAPLQDSHVATPVSQTPTPTPPTPLAHGRTADTNAKDAEDGKEGNSTPAAAIGRQRAKSDEKQQIHASRPVNAAR